MDSSAINNPHGLRKKMLKPRLVLLSMVAVAASACGTAPDTPPAPVPVETRVEPVIDEAPKGPSALQTLRQNGHLRYDFVDLTNLSTRTAKGGLRMDLGSVESRKHTSGGWEDGWDVERAAKERLHYFEATQRHARLWFSPPSGTYSRVVVRMRLVQRAAEVGFYINGERVHKATVGTQWEEVAFDVPKELARAGENALKLRFEHVPKVDRRRQPGQVDWVHVLPKDVAMDDLPTSPAVGTLVDNDVSKPSLIADAPQSLIYRLHVPSPAPMFGFDFVATQPGATLRVTAASDVVEEGARKTLFEHTVKEGQDWQEAVVDLSAYEGQVVELRLTSDGNWPQGQAVGWGQPGVFTAELSDDAVVPAKKGAAAKNVMVFLIDTMRHDRFNTYYDDGLDQTPAMDRFAQDALVYSSAYNPGNWTKPSVASIMTSLYPSSHGVRRPIDRVSGDLTLMSERFQDAGFVTASFVANAYVTPTYGFGQGWSHHRNYIKEPPANTSVDYVVDDTIKWLDANGDSDKRKFLYVHVIDPHAPYSAWPSFRKKFWDERYEGKIVPYLTDRQMNRVQQGRFKATETDQRFVNALYDAEVAFTDHHFERLMNALKERGLYDDTAILVVSDHGEEFWDHDRAGHGHSPHEELLHSPFFLRYPDRVPRGRVLPQVISTVNVAPTLLDLADVPMWEGAEGRSLVGEFDGSGQSVPDVALFEGQSRFMGVRAGRYRFVIYKGGERKLFDLLEDRTEQHDLAAERPIAQTYARTIIGLMLGASHKGQWWSSEQAGAPSLEVASQAAEVDEETRMQLEALGYVEGVFMEEAVEEDDLATD